MKSQGPGLRKAVRIMRNCRVQVRKTAKIVGTSKAQSLRKITRAIDKSEAQAYGTSGEPLWEFASGRDGANAPGHSCDLHCVFVGVDRLNPLVNWVLKGARGESHLGSFLFLLGIYEVSNVVMLGFSYDFACHLSDFKRWGGFSPVLHECRTSILLCDS